MDLKKRYVALFEELELRQKDLARVMVLGNSAPNLAQSARNKVSEKLKPVRGRGVSQADIVILELLLFMKTANFDIANIEFSGDGGIQSVPWVSPKYKKNVNVN